MAMALDGVHEGADIGGERIGDSRFAKDIALLVDQAEGLPKGQTGVAQRNQKMGMKLNIQKTECQFLGEGSKKFHLEVDGQKLEQTENFVLLYCIEVFI